MHHSASMSWYGMINSLGCGKCNFKSVISKHMLWVKVHDHLWNCSGECHRKPLICLHWFNYWLCAIRHQAITWTNVEVRQQAITWVSVDPDLCHQMPSSGHNELIHIMMLAVWYDKKKQLKKCMPVEYHGLLYTEHWKPNHLWHPMLEAWYPMGLRAHIGVYTRLNSGPTMKTFKCITAAGNGRQCQWILATWAVNVARKLRSRWDP